MVDTPSLEVDVPTYSLGRLGGSPEPRVALGLDVGGTKLAAGILDREGQVRGFSKCETPAGRGPEECLEALFALGEAAIDASGLTPTVVGISCGGPLDTTSGTVLRPLHLPLWDRTPVVAKTVERFGFPAFLENDATCGAVAEYLLGAGRDLIMGTLVYLTVSTGVGGGLVVGGTLHAGAARNGGEPGHVSVDPRGPLCKCGRRGCVEAYASGTALAQRTREAIAVGEVSDLSRLEEITAADVAQAALAGDPVGCRVWDEGMSALGRGIADVVNVLEPDRVVLGGGVTSAGSQMLEPVVQVVTGSAMRPAAAACDLSISSLGAAVCVAGAAAVAQIAQYRMEMFHD